MMIFVPSFSLDCVDYVAIRTTGVMTWTWCYFVCTASRPDRSRWCYFPCLCPPMTQFMRARVYLFVFVMEFTFPLLHKDSRRPLVPALNTQLQQRASTGSQACSLHLICRAWSKWSSDQRNCPSTGEPSWESLPILGLIFCSWLWHLASLDGTNKDTSFPLNQ